jgi:pantothenate synthetase
MSLDQKDIEIIEHMIFRNSDDIAISIARSFERLEKHTCDSEARLYSRLGEIEDRIDASRQDISDTIGDIKEEIRDSMRFKNNELYEV